MIPQAIANIGPYAGLWTDLKSMHHALERALGPSPRGGLTEFDRDRLRALADFLRNQFDSKISQDEEISLALDGPRYSLDFDARQVLKSLKSFEQWHRSGKIGTKEKSKKLIDSLEEYLQGFSGSWFPTPPQEEFRILRGFLSELLVRTETALLA
jgi:hypothetical protein